MTETFDGEMFICYNCNKTEIEPENSENPFVHFIICCEEQ